MFTTKVDKLLHSVLNDHKKTMYFVNAKKWPKSG